MLPASVSAAPIASVCGYYSYAGLTLKVFYQII